MRDPTLRYYACGSTQHNTAAMMRGGARQNVTFPSGVFLYDDGDRRILFDTGYAPTPWRTGAAGAIYRRLLPPSITPEQTARAQLEASGIDPDSITHVVLSHLHPDHIGGVPDFPRATFVISAGQEQALANPKLREGILRGLLPVWFDVANRVVVSESDFSEQRIGDTDVTMRVASLFADAPFLVVDLPGHARGHMGALIDDRVLLAGDAAWGQSHVANAPNLRLVPRLIQSDFDAYQQTAATLEALSNQGVRVIYSHDSGIEPVIL